MIDQLRKVLAPIQRRVMLMVVRSVIILADDSGKVQRLQMQLLADETVDDVDRIQEYGFTSRPLPGAEAVTLAVGGNRDHLVVIATEDRRTRPKDLLAGEVKVYHFLGYNLHFKNSGTAKLTALDFTVDTLTTTIGSITPEKVLMGETFVPLYNAHVHVGNLGALTGPPVIPLITVAVLSQTVKISR